MSSPFSSAASWLTRTRRQWQQRGRESVELARACWAAQRQKDADWKTAVLDQAQTKGNDTAVRILWWEKEWTLVRYHGLTGYVQQTQWWKNKNHHITTTRLPRLPTAGLFFSSSKSRNTLGESSQDTNDYFNNKNTNVSTRIGDDTTTVTSRSEITDFSPNANSSRIAFMITSRNKEELMALGYERAAVKSMTPRQASVVLDYQVIPAEYDERVPVLLVQQQQQQVAVSPTGDDDDNDQVSPEEKEQNAHSSSSSPLRLTNNKVEEKESPVKAPCEDGSTEESTRPLALSAVESGSIPPPPPDSSNQKEDATSSWSMSHLDHASSSSSSENNLWFELVQSTHHPDNSNSSNSTLGDGTTVVGLYRTEQEAKFAMETLQEFAQRRHSSSTTDLRTTPWYKVRPTVR